MSNFIGLPEIRLLKTKKFGSFPQNLAIPTKIAKKKYLRDKISETSPHFLIQKHPKISFMKAVSSRELLMTEQKSPQTVDAVA